MPLDDFFAKKEKKKSKKKKPQSLIEKLTKDVEKWQELEGDVPAEAPKVSITLGKEDEWDTLDDEEKDIDLQNIRIGKLELSAVEESSKSASKQIGEKEGDKEAEGDKVVWAHKVAEPPAEEPQPQIKIEVEPADPQLYVPVHLRPRGSQYKLAKPNVTSKADFPTLDGAVNAEPATKKAEEKTPHDDDGGGSWEKAGAPRKLVRPSETLPIAINPSPSSTHVPPGLRSGGGHSFAVPQREAPSDLRPRDEGSFQRFGGGGFKREGGHAPRESVGGVTSMSDWVRGNTIRAPPPDLLNAVSGSAFATRLPSPTRPAVTAKSNSEWPRRINIKTFRETNQDKTEFDLVQTNRFAGLGGT